MRVTRVYTDQILTPDTQIILEKQASHYLSQVLRLRSGDHLMLFNGDGEEFSGEITQATKNTVSVNIHTLLRKEVDPHLDICLVLGISRAERMDYALQKSVELGVTSIRPIFTQRCVVKLAEKRLEHRREHWIKIIISACEQSGRCRLPQLDSTCWLANALECTDYENGSRLLLDPEGNKSLLDIEQPDSAVTILIGPEGGLTDEEKTLAVKCGFIPIRLGPRVLRTETAPLAAIAAVQTLWGDFH